MGLSIVGSPSVATNAVSTTATVTTGAFTPVTPAMLLALWACNSQSGANPTAPSITDNLTSHALWATVDWESRADSGLEGQAAAFRAFAPLPSSMTVTVTTGASSGNREAALGLLPICGVDWNNPIGAHSKGSQGSGTTVTVNYTATRDGSWGFIVICDWDVAGAMTAGAGMSIVGSANIGTAITYGIARRSAADGVKGQTTTLAVNLGGSSTNIEWVAVEVIPELAWVKARRAPYSPLWVPGKARRPFGVQSFSESAVASGGTVDAVPGELLFVADSLIQPQIVASVVNLPFVVVAGLPQVQVIAAPASIALSAVAAIETASAIAVPAAIAFSAVASTNTPIVVATPVSLALSTVAATPVPQPVTLTATPASLAFSTVAALPQALVTSAVNSVALTAVAATPVPQPVNLTASPASLVFSVVASTFGSAANVDAAAVALAFSAIAATPVPQPVVLIASPSVLALSTVAALPAARPVGAAPALTFAVVAAIPVPQHVTLTGTPQALAFSAVAAVPATIGGTFDGLWGIEMGVG